MGMGKDSRNGFYISAGFILALGFSVIFSTFCGFYIGFLLDRGKPQKIFTPLGLLIGLFVGLHRAWVLLKSLMKKP